MTEPLPRITRYGGQLPAAPLRELLFRDMSEWNAKNATRTEGGVYLGITGVSERTGIPTQTLYRIAEGDYATVTLDTADKYLARTGRHLRDLWPWLYTDEQIAVDVAATDPGCPARERRRLAERARSQRRSPRARAAHAAGLFSEKPERVT